MLEEAKAKESALLDFVDQYCNDADSGEIHPLSHYLERFPGFEDEVAREYLRMLDRRSGTDGNPSGSSAELQLDSADHTGTHEPSTLLGKLRRRHTAERYQRLGRVARGGMGAVYRVRDEDLSRELAMKVMLAGSSLRLRRFLEEARVSGGLDHPGIVPVHELGLDAKGRLYFTMRLVQGRNLKEIAALLHRGDPEWTLSRALEVMIKVCDAMAYAHSKGVVHRDLKPANVMVGSFGEVYVMDWGLARALDREDLHDLRLAGNSSAAAPSSPLVTMDGDVVGTPSYMSPEQASGRAAELGVRSDVYSAGAILYHLLSGRPPYFEAPGESPAPRAVLERVLAGAPVPIGARTGQRWPELEAICEKAMARSPAARYADMGAMARDLRAYLEQRVVSAYGGGRWAELRKWVARNRGLSWSLAAAAGIAIAAGAIALHLRRIQHDLALLNTLRGSPLLLDTYKDIWPALPKNVPAMSSWIAQAESLVAKRAEHALALDELRARALPVDPQAPAEFKQREERNSKLRSIEENIERHRTAAETVRRTGERTVEGETLEELEARVSAFEDLKAEVLAQPLQRVSWSFARLDEQLRHDVLAQLLPELDRLEASAESRGLLERARVGVAFAETVEHESLIAFRDAWQQAVDAIADATRSPLYRGLRITPQIGLVPLGPDPDSGLWEFAHLQSGAPPVRDAVGRLVIGEENGVVLVLLPGGDSLRGAHRVNGNFPHFDPRAESTEWPTMNIPLDPFFLSKYEMTQAQWRRWLGANPSRVQPTKSPELCDSELHPMESVSWLDCTSGMRELGLTLPSEAQWEYAARAGTDTPWSTGGEPGSLDGAANIADREGYRTHQSSEYDMQDLPGFDDGFGCHAPIGSLRPNTFGLHDVHGNVAEWCRDQGRKSYSTPIRLGTGEHEIWPDGWRIARGGSFQDRANEARSSARQFDGPELADPSVGLRPSRALDE